MKGRLSDEELSELSSIVNAFLPSRGLSLWCRLLMDRIEDETELRERRALDLSDAERELIDWGLGVLSSDYNDVPHEEIQALRKKIEAGASWNGVVDRLLADKEER